MALYDLLPDPKRRKAGAPGDPPPGPPTLPTGPRRREDYRPELLTFRPSMTAADLPIGGGVVPVLERNEAAPQRTDFSQIDALSRAVMGASAESRNRQIEALEAQARDRRRRFMTERFGLGALGLASGVFVPGEMQGSDVSEAQELAAMARAQGEGMEATERAQLDLSRAERGLEQESRYNQLLREYEDRQFDRLAQTYNQLSGVEQRNEDARFANQGQAYTEAKDRAGLYFDVNRDRRDEDRLGLERQRVALARAASARASSRNRNRNPLTALGRDDLMEVQRYYLDIALGVPQSGKSVRSTNPRTGEVAQFDFDAEVPNGRDRAFAIEQYRLATEALSGIPDVPKGRAAPDYLYDAPEARHGYGFGGQDDDEAAALREVLGASGMIGY